MKKELLILMLVVLTSAFAQVDYEEGDLSKIDFSTADASVWTDSAVYSNPTAYNNPSFYANIPDTQYESMEMSSVLSSGNLDKMSSSQLAVNMDDLPNLDNIVTNAGFNQQTFDEAVKQKTGISPVFDMTFTFGEGVTDITLTDQGMLSHKLGGKAASLNINDYRPALGKVTIQAVREGQDKSGFIIDGQKIVSTGTIAISPTMIVDEKGGTIVPAEGRTLENFKLGDIVITSTKTGDSHVDMGNVGKLTLPAGTKVTVNEFVFGADDVKDGELMINPNGDFIAKTTGTIRVNRNLEAPLLNEKEITIHEEGLVVDFTGRKLKINSNRQTDKWTQMVTYKEIIPDLFARRIFRRAQFGEPWEGPRDGTLSYDYFQEGIFLTVVSSDKNTQAYQEMNEQRGDTSVFRSRFLHSNVEMAFEDSEGNSNQLDHQITDAKKFFNYDTGFVEPYERVISQSEFAAMNNPGTIFFEGELIDTKTTMVKGKLYDSEGDEIIVEPQKPGLYVDGALVEPTQLAAGIYDENGNRIMSETLPQGLYVENEEGQYVRVEPSQEKGIFDENGNRIASSLPEGIFMDDESGQLVLVEPSEFEEGVYDEDGNKIAVVWPDDIFAESEDYVPIAASETDEIGNKIKPILPNGKDALLSFVGSDEICLE